MTEQERELDLALAEALQENRKLREDNEELKTILDVERMAVRDMGDILSNYEDLMAEMKQRITELENT
jgi:hypothetical protein